MGTKAVKHWLLAYDIRSPKRLQRIHAFLVKRGYPLQYSVFGLEMTDAQLHDLLADLETLMRPSVDDIRAYHIPPYCKVWTLGRQGLPEGIQLEASAVMKMLARPAKASVEGVSENFSSASVTLGMQRDFCAEEANSLPRSQGD